MTASPAEPPSSSPESRADGSFQSTLWSQVRIAGRSEVSGSRQALEELCRAYWQPIYAFLRRCGHGRDNAKDLTQGFFVYLLERGLLQKADAEKGRFRSFLLGSLKFFVSNEQARERALKRGGGAKFLPLDVEPAEQAASWEPATTLTPERLFERKWAMAVIGQAVERLAEEYRRAGMEEQFEVLQPYLTGDPDGPLPELAVRLGKTHGATRLLMLRLRNRFRRLIRAVIADTVSDVDQIESELRYLEEALREE
jgi:DNA-directed RNA polymerase specialized sigma24 family protein